MFASHLSFCHFVLVLREYMLLWMKHCLYFNRSGDKDNKGEVLMAGEGGGSYKYYADGH